VKLLYRLRGRKSKSTDYTDYTDYTDWQTRKAECGTAEGRKHKNQKSKIDSASCLLPSGFSIGV